MRRFFIFICILLAPSLSNAIEIKPAEGYEFIDAGYRVTDQQGIQDAIAYENWLPREAFRIPGNNSHLWLKTRVYFEKEGINGLYISALASFELFWEAELIFQSGRPGNKETTELPGNIDNYILLPKPVESGEHTFYMRLSRDNLPGKYRHSSIDFTFNDYQSLLNQKTAQSLFPLLSLGALLVISIYYLSVYHSQRYRPYQLFSLLCMVVALWLLAENWRPLFGYTWQWHGTRLWVISVLSGVFGMLLPLFLAYEFRFRIPAYTWTIQIPVFVILHGVVDSFDLITGIFVLQGFVLSLILVITARLKGHKATTWTILSLSTALFPVVLDPTDYLEQWFFVLFPLVILALLHNLSITMKALKADREKAIALGKSLQLQLLKNSIQPHFLLNTLTSLSEWIEKSPDTAQEMIEQLAEEFYLLGTMVEKPLVSLEEELTLCKTHLRLMSLRKNCQFRLQCQSVQADINIPPGTLHTIIENAFSHNVFHGGEYTFTITQTAKVKGATIIMQCPLTSDKRIVTEKAHSGTGTEYIEQRLQQAFGDSWTLSHSRSNDSWITTMRFPANGASF